MTTTTRPVRVGNSPKVHLATGTEVSVTQANWTSTRLQADAVLCGRGIVARSWDATIAKNAGRPITLRIQEEYPGMVICPKCLAAKEA